MVIVGSITGNTNTFKVDTTPPLKPNTPIAAIVPAAQSSLTPMAQTATVKFTIEIPQTLDAESGVKNYRIWRKSAKDPNWAVITCNTATTTNSTVDVLKTQDLGDIYTYKLQVKNNANDWSDVSDVTNLDLRTNSVLIDTFYNGPNPFDSRTESTTLYYSLGNNADVEIRILDIFGYVVKKWSFASGTPGGSMTNSIVWDGTNTFGDKATKGAYFAVLKATDAAGNTMKKMCKIGVIL